MERAVGGELFDAIVNDSNANKISEHTIKAYFYQIVHCIRHLHRNKLCHRDLKLENIFIGEKDNRGDMSILKVADFGASKSSSGSCGPLETYVGTPVYMAPEVSRLEHRLDTEEGDYLTYSHKVDCWSLGVILYTMLCGRRPFSGSRSDLHRQIMAGRFSPMEGPSWGKISSAAKDLVRKLLDVDPETRWSTEQVMGHKWIIEDEAAVNVAKAVMFMNLEEEDNFNSNKK